MSSGSYVLGSYDIARLEQVGSNDAVDITFLMRSGLFGTPESAPFARVRDDSGHYDLELWNQQSEEYTTVAELHDNSSISFHVIWDDHLFEILGTS